MVAVFSFFCAFIAPAEVDLDDGIHGAGVDEGQARTTKLDGYPRNEPLHAVPGHWRSCVGNIDGVQLRTSDTVRWLLVVQRTTDLDATNQN